MDNGASSYRRFLNGDDTGLIEIIRDYKDGLTLYLSGIVGNIFIAEELMEETFFKLTVKQPRFFGKSSFKTWIYAIGRNIAIDHLRQSSKLSSQPIEDLDSLLMEEQAVEKAYLKEENKILLHNAMRQLKPEYRQILYLIYFEELSNSQAAALMKKSRRQAENLIYRAKKSLGSILEKEGFVYEEL